MEISLADLVTHSFLLVLCFQVKAREKSRMQNGKVLLSLFCCIIASISALTERTKRKSINTTHVLDQYISVCGHDYLCSTDSIPTELRSKRQYKPFITCPACSCEASCIQKRTCCPDFYLSFPTMQCGSVDLPEFPLVNSSYLRVSDCPIGTPDSQWDGCKGTNQSLVDKLLLPPVTSTGEFRITFKNKFCAECNGYFTYEPWDMNMTCLDFADFNYLSSYEEILVLARDRRCGISYMPSNVTDAIKCSNTDKEKTFIDSCNVNYLLGANEDDIATMCDSDYELMTVLSGHSRVRFKNIFCYMCNPSYSDDNVISECNNSTMQQENDKAVEESCRRYPLTPVTYPFKNIFCYLCNRNSNLTSTFIEGNISIDHCISRSNSPYEYKIAIDKLNADYFLQFVDVITTNMDIPTYLWNISRDMYTFYELTHNINLTNAFQKIYAFQNATFCERKWNLFLQSNYSFCNCSNQDMLCMRTCCVDFAFVYPASCYLFERAFGVFPISSSSILMVDGCSGTTLPEDLAIYKHLCESRQLIDSIFGSFPVMYTGNSATYLNTYCAICNERRTQFRVKDSIHSMLFYYLRLRCPHYISFQYHTSLTSIIQVARKLKCDMNFFPPIQNVDTCFFGYPDISTCNVTGNWPIFDPDVKHGCEITEHHRLPQQVVILKNGSFISYKNVFCALCNPVSSVISDVVSNCNTTGVWEHYDSRIERACAMLPRIHASYPYKNYFCMACNGREKTLFPVYDPYINSGGMGYQCFKALPYVGSKSPVTTLRNLFSLSTYGNGRIRAKTLKCEKEQIFDFSAVRTLVNSAGFSMDLLLYTMIKDLFTKMSILKLIPGLPSHAHKTFLLPGADYTQLVGF